MKMLGFQDRLSSLFTSTTWGGAFAGGYGWMTFNQWLAVGGFVCAVLGVVLTHRHNNRMYRLRQKELEILADRAGKN